MSNHISYEYKGHSCDGSATWPEYPKKDQRGASCWLHSQETNSEKDQGPGWLHLRTTGPGAGPLFTESAEISEIAENTEVFRGFPTSGDPPDKT